MLHRNGVIDLLSRQHWVASMRQLHELGVSRQSVSLALSQGLVHRVMTAVVGVKPHCDTFEARCTALQLVAPPDSFLSGRTAGRLHGLRRMPVHPVEITIPQGREMTVPSWARLSTTCWPDHEPRPPRDDALVVASPLRTLFGLASRLGDRGFATAAEDAWHLGLISPADAATYLASIRRQGRSGVTRLEAWLERASGIERPATTGLELLLVDLARSAGLPEPVRQYPLRLVSGRIIHLDLAWPDVRFAVEPGHSWWHGGDRGQRADQDRDRECAAVGWLVARFDESTWERRRETIRQLRSMYAARARGQIA